MADIFYLILLATEQNKHKPHAIVVILLWLLLNNSVIVDEGLAVKGLCCVTDIWLHKLNDIMNLDDFGNPCCQISFGTPWDNSVEHDSNNLNKSIHSDPWKSENSD